MTAAVSPLGTRVEPYPVTGAFPPLFTLVAAHGGSGAGTLSRMWAPAADGGQFWPAQSTGCQRVILVAREHMAGIGAAAAALRSAAAGAVPSGVEIHGLITVAARPGKTPRDVVRYADTVADLAPHHWRIGWIDQLISLRPEELPSWQPGDPVQSTRKTSGGDLATVPGQIAQTGLDITTTFAELHSATH